MVRYLFIIIVLFTSLGVSAQQDPQYSQYLFNGVVVNPGYAGSREYINFNGNYRKQWTTVTGSPTSQLVSLDMPLYRNRAGVGMYAFNDELGAQFRRSLFAVFAYRIKVSTNGRLALGVSAGVNQVGVKGDELVTDIPNDPAIPTNKMSKTKPDMQAGLYFNTPRFFAGLSLSNIITNDYKDIALAPDSKHMYFTTGFVAPLDSKFKVRPSMLVKEDFKGPTNMDVTAFLIYKDRIWLGSSYRTRVFSKNNLEKNVAKDAVVFMVELFPIENLRIGYGYDLSLNTFKNYSTHEFSLGYNINPYRENKMLTPRYF